MLMAHGWAIWEYKCRKGIVGCQLAQLPGVAVALLDSFVYTFFPTPPITKERGDPLPLILSLPSSL